MKKIIIIVSIVLSIVLFGGIFASLLLKPNTESVDDVDWYSLSYTALGDSITYGYTPNTDGVQMDKPYCSAVADILQLKSSSNLGISGSTLTDNWYGMAKRIDTIPIKSDIISVFGGTNDWSHNWPLGTINDADDSTIYGSLNVICSYLTTNFKDSFVFLITPYPRRGAGVNSSGYSLYDVRDAFINIGKKYNFPVLNFTDYGHFQTEMNDVNISDGLHPTQEFVLKYTAPQIAEFIKDNYKK